jgi:hypothetical protein
LKTPSKVSFAKGLNGNAQRVGVPDFLAIEKCYSRFSEKNIFAFIYIIP